MIFSLHICDTLYEVLGWHPCPWLSLHTICGSRPQNWP